MKLDDWKNRRILFSIAAASAFASWSSSFLMMLFFPVEICLLVGFFFILPIFFSAVLVVIYAWQSWIVFGFDHSFIGKKRSPFRSELVFGFPNSRIRIETAGNPWARHFHCRWGRTDDSIVFYSPFFGFGRLRFCDIDRVELVKRGYVNIYHNSPEIRSPFGIPKKSFEELREGCVASGGIGAKT